MAIQQQENAEEEIAEEVPTHGFNLRKHPIKCMEIVLCMTKLVLQATLLANLPLLLLYIAFVAGHSHIVML